MLELYRTLSLRYLLRRGLRTVLIVLSITLGVAVLIGTESIHQQMRASGRSAYTPLAGVADLFVTNPAGVNRGVLQAARQALAEGRLPGVEAVRPLILHKGCVLPELDNRPVTVFGWELDPSASTQAPVDSRLGLKFTQTRPLTTIEYGLMVRLWGQYPAFAGAALNADLKPGTTTLKVKASSGDAPKTVALYGTVDASGPAASLGGSVLYLPLDDAAAVVNQPDRFTRIDVTLAEGADREAARARLQEVVGAAGKVELPTANDEKLDRLMSGVEASFTLVPVCALVVGLFLVYNALSVSVAERRHDIGVLRSMGATRTQIAGLFAGEAFLLGLVGSVLGVPVGWLMASGAVSWVRQLLTDLFGVEMQGWPPLTPGLVALALVCGVFTALLAALVPALQAAREEPADAVRRAPPTGGRALQLAHVVVCAAMVLAGLLCVPLRPYLPVVIANFGPPALVLIGLLAATPLFAAASGRLVRPPSRWLLGVPERLAADNLSRSPGRTGLVVAALAACVALMVETAGVQQSTEDAIMTWIDRTLAADLFVSANSPITSGGGSQPISEELAKKIQALPEVRQVVPIRYHLTDHAGQPVYLVATAPEHFLDRQRVREPLPGMELMPRLREPGAALVSENFATLYHVSPGDALEFPGPDGPVTLRVIGAVRDYTWMAGAVYVDRDQFRTRFGDGEIDRLMVTLKDGKDPEAVRQTLAQTWGATESLVVLTRQEVSDLARANVRKLYGFAYAQEVVVGAVAALGVLMALLISVLRRRRELGVLRAVGASRWQVLRTVLAEAMLMGLVGSLIGLAYGLPLEWYAVNVLLLYQAGFTFPPSVPVVAVGVVIAASLALATVAGLWPALRAVRLRIADAIAYE